MTKKIMILGIVMSCLLLFSAAPTISADELETLNDPVGDVYVLDEESLTTVEDFSDLETTSDKPNLDIKSIVYSKEDGVKEVTVTFEVYGEIEDSGINYDLLDVDDVDDLDYSSLLDPIVSYMVSINTSEQAYTITYNNEICKITRGDAFGLDIFGTDLGTGGENCTYEKDGSTLTFTFDLDDADETFVQMTAQSMYYDLGSLFSSDEDESIEIYIDMAPNPLKVSADGPSKGKVGDAVKFSASTDEGTSPYRWEWDFDDDYEIDSTEQNPSYTYSQDGTYYPSVSVTDAEGRSGIRSLTIEILSGSSNGGNSGNNGGSGNGLMVFISLILVVVIAGAAVLFYVLKR
jgi:hypothetical protein